MVLGLIRIKVPQKRASYFVGMYPDTSPEYLVAWQCVGCGRIEAPQTCIGVCRDKKVFVIGKQAHERALGETARLKGLLSATGERLLRFAQCTPRNGQFQEAFTSLQDQVRILLSELSTRDTEGH